MDIETLGNVQAPKEKFELEKPLTHTVPIMMKNKNGDYEMCGSFMLSMAELGDDILPEFIEGSQIEGLDQIHMQKTFVLKTFMTPDHKEKRLAYREMKDGEQRPTRPVADA